MSCSSSILSSDYGLCMAESLALPYAPAIDGDVQASVCNVIEYLQNYKNVRMAHKCWLHDADVGMEDEYKLEKERFKLSQSSFAQLQALFDRLSSQNGLTFDVQALITPTTQDKKQQREQITKDLSRGAFCTLALNEQAVNTDDDQELSHALDALEELVKARLHELQPAAKELRLHELLNCLQGCFFAGAKDSLEYFLADHNVLCTRSQEHQDSLKISVNQDAFKVEGRLVKDMYLELPSEIKYLGTIQTELTTELVFDSLWIDWDRSLALMKVPVRHFCKSAPLLDVADFGWEHVAIPYEPAQDPQCSWLGNIGAYLGNASEHVLNSVKDRLRRWQAWWS